MHGMRRMVVGSAVCLLATGTARGDVVLEIAGGTEFTVEQGTPYSSTQLHPVDGDGLIIWAETTNTGTEIFEAIGLFGVGFGTVGSVALTAEPPYGSWDPDADPNDALIWSPGGYPAIALEPGESFNIAMLETWGVQFGGFPLPDLYGPAPLGGYMTVQGLEMSLWTGLDNDPIVNDPDLELVLPWFTITVVPEPTTAWMTALVGLVALRTIWARAKGPTNRPRARTGA